MKSVKTLARAAVPGGLFGTGDLLTGEHTRTTVGRKPRSSPWDLSIELP